MSFLFGGPQFRKGTLSALLSLSATLVGVADEGPTADVQAAVPMTEIGASAVVWGGWLRVFARGTDGTLWQHYWDGQRWRAGSLNTQIAGAPSAVVKGPPGAQVLFVYAVDPHGALKEYFYQGGGHWYSQVIIPNNCATGPAAIVHTDGSSHVFVRTRDGLLIDARPNGPIWDTTVVAAGVNGPLSVTSYNYEMNVFYRNAGGALEHAHSVGSYWRFFTITGLGEITSATASIAQAGSQYLRVFARGANGELWQYYSTVPDRWIPGPITDGPVAGGPAAVEYGGHLRVFARGPDGHLWQHLWNGRVWEHGKLPTPPVA